MLIPCHQITLNGANGTCATKTQPKYFAKMYEAMWRRKLNDSTGIQITEMPADTPDALRYRYAHDVAAEERSVIAYFANNTTATDGDNNRMTRQARELFQIVFPEGLRREIEELMREDAKRAQAEAAKERPDTRPHPSFMEAGCNAEEAVALQQAGFATLDDLPEDLIAVTTGSGLTPGKAIKLINSKVASKKMPAMASPVAAVNKA